ncbi:MAG: TMEM43 family protein [Thermoguttaceae bacterium]|nr:TMEM43 family protein [Thermoguttaceae bacterium]
MAIETISQSWGSRVGGAFKGILVGFVLVGVSIFLLFWNEGRTVKRTSALKEAARVVVEAKPSPLDSNLEGKVVHLTGDAVSEETLVDPYFNVSVEGIKLSRKVEIYQWEENVESSTSRGSGGSETTKKTYSYNKVWSENLIDSSNFYESGHENPSTVPVQSESFIAKRVSLGDYVLSDSLVEQTGPSEPFVPDQAISTNVKENENVPDVSGADSSDASDDDQAPVDPLLDLNNEAETQDDKTNSSTLAGFVKTSDGFYKGTIDTPQIGDMRVSFELVPPTAPISVISQQSGDSFVPYKAKTGEVELLEFGIVDANEMFSRAHRSNKLIAWLLRLVGFVVMSLGFATIFKPLAVVADVVPFLGKFVGAGTGVAAFCLALAVSCLTIAAGWIAYRPLVAIPLVVASLAAIVYPFFKGKKSK